MKKSLYILLTALIATGLAACGAPTATTTPSFVATEISAVVEFADPVLEVMVRGAIGQPEGDISLAQARAVTRLDLNDELRGFLSQEPKITDINGLEAFTNLETLDLSTHAVTDISQLAGLTNLTALSLAGNPVADVSPLAGLTGLKLLILSGSQAQDYSVLSSLANLQVLLLDNSTITDLTPLTGLTHLNTLYLANTSTEDYSPLENIYPTLAKKDFIIPSALVELGFYMDQFRHKAQFDGEDASFYIHHSKWGPPPSDREKDNVEIAKIVGNDYKLGVGFFVDQNIYEILVFKDGEELIDYYYDEKSGQFAFETGDQQSSELTLRAQLSVDDGEDVLLAPIGIFNDAIKKNFKMTPEKLFAMPYEPPSLKNLGFFADETNAVYLFEQRGEKDVNVEVHRPEWGEREHDVRFNTPLSDEYRIVVTWHATESKFIASVDDNSQGGASFEYFIDTGEFIDGWCSYKDKTVEEYFIKAYNDPAITDVYQHSIDLMVQYVSDTFGMTIEELYSLPTGE